MDRRSKDYLENWRNVGLRAVVVVGWLVWFGWLVGCCWARFKRVGFGYPLAKGLSSKGSGAEANLGGLGF